MTEEKYIDGEYFKKSKVFLFPLVGFFRTTKFKPDECYLYAEYIEENIEDFNLLCLYKTDYNESFSQWEQKDLLTRDNLINCYKVEDGLMAIFDLCKDYSEEVSNFLEGKYSQYSDQAKKKICNYLEIYNHEPSPDKVISRALYPEKYYQPIADELGIEVKEMPRELGSLYDKKDETYSGKILEEKSNCTNNSITKYL